jgi:CRP-like cAMP-binding protein
VPADLLRAMAAHAATRRYARGDVVYHAGGSADRWYQVVTGIAARCTDLSDGRRQILELLLPGDFFGFSAGEEHQHRVEAMVGDTRVSSYSRRTLERLSVTDPRIERGLRELAFAAIGRLDERLVTVGRLSATERVAAFLVEMAERIPRDPGEQIELPMSRFEIADYLGLSMESVSRSIGQLKRKSAIALMGPHRVELLDPSILSAKIAAENTAPATQSSEVKPSRRA